MIIKVPGEINVAVPAAKAWRVLAHEYVNIGDWNSAIPVSKAVGSKPSFEGARAGGRLCSTNVPGFAGITEAFTHYDEANMSFSYEVVDGNPAFVLSATNHWSVEARGAEACVINIDGAVELKNFPGYLLSPFMRLQFRIIGQRTAEELKHYLETDTPHPRKQKQLNKARMAPLV